MLRDDDISRDLGYPRSVQRPDEKVVAAYYIPDEATGPGRFVGVTIRQP